MTFSPELSSIGDTASRQSAARGPGWQVLSWPPSQGLVWCVVPTLAEEWLQLWQKIHFPTFKMQISIKKIKPAQFSIWFLWNVPSQIHNHFVVKVNVSVSDAYLFQWGLIWAHDVNAHRLSVLPELLTEESLTWAFVLFLVSAQATRALLVRNAWISSQSTCGTMEKLGVEF